MARTELPNGVILPAEYSDDWYEDMTSNLTKLDDVIGSDSEKLNSNDVAFLRMSSAALTDGGTGNFSDLNSSNKLKTGDYVLDSGRKLYQVVSVDSTNERFTVGNSLFKVTAESDLAPVAESGDYDDLDNKPDLNPYDQHIADTDIHVTTADKTKWNTNVTQSFVFRYSSTALVASSTNSNTLLDNTDNLKVGDKVIDSSGVLFSITAIDSVNSTFTVGSALIDLALDANVVHTSGNETVGGQKIFTNSIILQNSDTSGVSRDLFSKSQVAVLGDVGSSDNTKYRFVDKNNNEICYIRQRKLTNSNTDMSFCVNNIDNDNNSISAEINFIIDRNNDPCISPSLTDFISLGRPTFRWKSIYSNSYYYGNVEFSTKFVTTDTNQTISGAKTFSSYTTIYNSDTSANTPNLILQSSKIQLGDTSNSDTQSIVFNAGSSFVAKVESFKDTAGTQNLQNTVRTKDASNNVISAMYRLRLFNSGFAVLESNSDNTISLGRNNTRWKDCQTYLINGLTPSSLSLPSNMGYVDISGYFTNTGDGQTNSYTASANGWIYLNVIAKTLIMQIRDSNDNVVYADMRVRSSDGTIYMTIPIGSGNKLLTQWFTSSSVTVTTARFIPCQGNI